MSDIKSIVIEAIGWTSTVSFLISILMPKRGHLHLLGVFTAVTTGIYAYAHGATAIWVKWAIAFFFHLYMTQKMNRVNRQPASNGPNEAISRQGLEPVP